MSNYNNEHNKIRTRKVNEDTKSLNKNLKTSKNSSSKVNDNGKTNKSVTSKTRRNNTRSKKRKKRKLKNTFKNALIGILIILIIASASASAFVFSALKDSPPVTKELLQQNYLSNQIVEDKDIPKYLKDAIVSIEDERFYKHNGVDIKSLVRSVLHNILTDTTQGGSTIEMQISKNLLTNDNISIKRKIKDIFNAFSMDKNLTKEEILDIYLNNIYLGRSSYGVSEGSQAYFGKKLQDLNLAECAMLAGITNSPGKFGHFDEAKKRQETILYKMHELGYISDNEYNDALNQAVSFI